MIFKLRPDHMPSWAIAEEVLARNRFEHAQLKGTGFITAQEMERINVKHPEWDRMFDAVQKYDTLLPGRHEK